MLGKILKYEWISTAKVLLPANIILIIIAVLGRLEGALNFGNSDNNIIRTMYGVLIVTFVLAIIAVVIVTFIYLIVRFYRSMYKDEGYLTHTLPVKSGQLIMGKYIVAFCWLIIDVVVSSLAVVILFYSGGFWDEFLGAIIAIGEDFSYLSSNDAFLLAETIVAGSLSIIYAVVLVGLCISIGQLFEKHKIAGAILVGFGIGLVRQFASGIFLTGTLNNILYTDITATNFINTTFLVINIVQLDFIVGFYFLTWYLVKNKLNLE